MATCEQPDTKYDLEKLHQSSGESLRDFIRHFSKIRNSFPNITNVEAIAAFTKVLQHEQLHGKLYHKRPTTIGELIQIANGYADAEEAERAARSAHHQRRDDDRRELSHPILHSKTKYSYMCAQDVQNTHIYHKLQ